MSMLVPDLTVRSKAEPCQSGSEGRVRLRRTKRNKATRTFRSFFFFNGRHFLKKLDEERSIVSWNYGDRSVLLSFSLSDFLFCRNCPEFPVAFLHAIVIIAFP
jgi:hypothetical protein